MLQLAIAYERRNLLAFLDLHPGNIGRLSFFYIRMKNMLVRGLSRPVLHFRLRKCLGNILFLLRHLCDQHVLWIPPLLTCIVRLSPIYYCLVFRMTRSMKVCVCCADPGQVTRPETSPISMIIFKRYRKGPRVVCSESPVPRVPPHPCLSN